MPNETWTIKRCLDWTRDYLRDKGDERPRLSAEWLLSGVTGLSRTEIYMSFDKPMSPEELARMHSAVVRRAKGEPLQYIIGETDFRTITVACVPGVLIPRPETELLVEETLKYIDADVLGAAASRPRSRVELPWNAEIQAAREAELATAAAQSEDRLVERELTEEDIAALEEDAELEAGDSGDSGDEVGLQTAVPRDGEGVLGSASANGVNTSDDDDSASQVARVLEVGCGTGCISLSIAAERPEHTCCVAIDIEPRAVDLSIRNRDALGIAPDVVDVRLGNLVSPLNRETEWGTFDVLVSNPPYIPTSVMGNLPHEVADYEPALALDGGEDGLDIFRRLVNAAPHMLKPGGLLACELYEGHLDQAASLCRAAGMREVRVVNDLTNRPRIILARV
ncbi:MULTISPECIES: HemK/PrmC family methyltransferase [Collinsella]|uniref:N5-glutamine methyltransferase family protein n=1 Tax=Collinsella TaxID=102106 RepID=UPI000E500738|nr:MULTISPECIES: HemK/PrmC family methyltransferase [Collinsella]MBS6555171.1 peptide chain release factor N(5)-glutamine methyltransferase [Collinsella stercoris]RHS38723.1 peptide chain release factor N(5)-glutamine methyltransferase [Collinsella sp. AF08-23]